MPAALGAPAAGDAARAGLAAGDAAAAGLPAAAADAVVGLAGAAVGEAGAGAEQAASSAPAPLNPSSSSARLRVNRIHELARSVIASSSCPCVPAGSFP